MCPDCEARRKLARDALLRAKIGEAITHAAKGAAEAVGIKKKTGASELTRRDSKTPAKPVSSPVGQTAE